jgi:hypothetical protein
LCKKANQFSQPSVRKTHPTELAAKKVMPNRQGNGPAKAIMGVGKGFKNSGLHANPISRVGYRFYLYKLRFQ